MLAAGGYGDGGTAAVASTELYDPGSGSWTVAGIMVIPRWDHTATLLSDGRVLAVGGRSPAPLNSTELYDPGGRT